jgi:hypothetical protein
MTTILVRREKKVCSKQFKLPFHFLLPNEKNAMIFILKSLKTSNIIAMKLEL